MESKIILCSSFTPDDEFQPQLAPNLPRTCTGAVVLEFDLTHTPGLSDDVKKRIVNKSEVEHEADVIHENPLPTSKNDTSRIFPLRCTHTPTHPHTHTRTHTRTYAHRFLREAGGGGV